MIFDIHNSNVSVSSSPIPLSFLFVAAARAQQVITFEIFQPLRIADDDRFRDHTLHLREMVAARAPKNGVTDASAVPQALKRAAADAQQKSRTLQRKLQELQDI